MNNNIFKITLTAVYKDNVDPNKISDNIWNTMKSIDNNLIMIDVNEIKKMKRTEQIMKKLLTDISIQKEEDLSIQENCVVITKNKKQNKKRKNENTK